MSPLEIEVLLHCHCCPAPHPNIDAPAVAETMEMFLDNGIIKRVLTPGTEAGIYYHTTDRGKVLVKLLCSVPFPVQKCLWVDQNNNIIEI